MTNPKTILARSMMTPAERKKGIMPFDCTAWKLRVERRGRKLKRQMVAGAERRETKRLERAKAHSELLKNQTT